MPDPGHLGRPVRKNPASPSIDRRVARTRHALQQAFLSLILSKGYEATTIDEICAVANVGRSTFYAHFTGKDDLKRSGLDHLRRTLQARQNGSPSRPDGSKGFGFSRPASWRSTSSATS
jgi:AcrR family transcriptional regulator